MGDWIALLKPRVMSLVVFSGLVGLLAAPGAIHLTLALTTVLCIAVGAGASGAINMWGMTATSTPSCAARPAGRSRRAGSSPVAR